MRTSPVGEDLDRRAVLGEEGERAGWEDGWEAQERGAVVLVAVVEEGEVRDVVY